MAKTKDIIFLEKIMNLLKEECKKWYLNGFKTAMNEFRIDLNKIINKNQIYYHPSSGIHLDIPFDEEEIAHYIAGDYCGFLEISFGEQWEDLDLIYPKKKSEKDEKDNGKKN